MGLVDGSHRLATDLPFISFGLGCAGAPLASCRLGQGLGLGGEWGGAVLLATENAPPGKARAVRHVPTARCASWVSSSPAASSCCSPEWLSDEQFFAFGWRIPFLASAVLVVIGLYVRLKISETPVFREAIIREENG